MCLQQKPNDQRNISLLSVCPASLMTYIYSDQLWVSRLMQSDGLKWFQLVVYGLCPSAECAASPTLHNNVRVMIVHTLPCFVACTERRVAVGGEYIYLTSQFDCLISRLWLPVLLPPSVKFWTHRGKHLSSVIVSPSEMMKITFKLTDRQASYIAIQHNAFHAVFFVCYNCWKLPVESLDDTQWDFKNDFETPFLIKIQTCRCRYWGDH